MALSKKGNFMARLDSLIAISKETGATLDAVHALTKDLDSHALRKASGRVSALPKYRKSRLNSYTRANSIAPLSDSLDDPTSQFE